MWLFEDVAKAKHNDYYPELTGLRGIAALWVLVFHVRHMTGGASNRLNIFGIDLDFSSLFSMGATYGVHIFFVLSGFLLSIPFIRWLENDGSFPNLKRYYVKRVIRVFPAYYVQLFILLLAIYFLGYTAMPSFKEIILHLFMMFRLEPWFISPIEGVWWTLPTEFGFYLVLPLLAICFRRIGMVWGVLIGVLLTILFRYAFYQSVSDQGVGMIIAKTERFPGHISLFLIGMSASYLFYLTKQRYEQLKAVYLWIILAVGLVGIYVASRLLSHWAVAGDYFGGHYSYFVWNSVNALFLACVIFVAANRLWICRWILGNPVCVFLGTISYSVYLWHFPIMKATKAYLFVDSYPENMQYLLISFPLVIIVSALSYQFVEAPAMRWGGKFAASIKK